jgi:hypothetical protein
VETPWDGHIEEKCWKLSLELRLKWLKFKGKSKIATKPKEEEVERTFDQDEVIVYATL